MANGEQASGPGGRRPWWRPHGSTVVCLVAVAVPLAAIVVPAEPINWTQSAGTLYAAGWPLSYATGSIPDSSPPFMGQVDTSAPPWMDWHSWWIPGLRSLSFDAVGLVSDAAFVLATLFVTGACLERRRRRRSFWQLSITEGLSVMLVVAIVVGWIANQHRSYERQFPAIARLAPFHNEMAFDLPVYKGPAWLKRLVPEDWRTWFDRYDSLNMCCKNGDQPPLEVLADLPGIENVLLSGHWTDAQVEQIAAALPLVLLRIDSTTVGEKGVVAAARIPMLRYLYLIDVVPGERGVAALASRESLDELLIDRTQMSEEEVLRLAGARGLRNVTIDRCRGLPDRTSLESDLKAKVEALRPNDLVTGGIEGISWD